jgi:hypothetical protein
MMYFTKSYLVDDLAIRTPVGHNFGTYAESKLLFRFVETHEVTVRLKNPTEEEMQRGREQGGVLICEASTRLDPNPRVRAAFEALAERRPVVIHPIPDDPPLGKQSRRPPRPYPVRTPRSSHTPTPTRTRSANGRTNPPAQTSAT